MNIDIKLVQQLIQHQFVQWATLPIYPVENMGHDNRTFHLGKEMSIRLPSAKEYVLQAKKEQTWLPYLQRHLRFSIPTIIAKGKPEGIFPYEWTIYKWLDGEFARKENICDMEEFARQLAIFLQELQSIDCQGGPVAGAHNFYRGGSLQVYHQETMKAIEKQTIFDKKKLLQMWQESLASRYQGKPVFVHGDMAPTNILVKEGKLSAIIDFGILGVGDPACDLAMYWTFFTGHSRQVFKDTLAMDESMWLRARGWVLWKALISLFEVEEKRVSEAKDIVSLLLDEYQ